MYIVKGPLQFKTRNTFGITHFSVRATALPVFMPFVARPIGRKYLPYMLPATSYQRC